MIRYTTGTPEVKEFTLIPEGVYQFTVASADEKVSTNRNPMIKLKLDVLDENGDRIGTVFDQLIQTKSSEWKLDQFLASIGKHPGGGQEFEINARDLIGESGTAKIIIGKPNDENKQFNEVGHYLFQEGEF